MTGLYVLKLRGKGEFQYVRLLANKTSFVNVSLRFATLFNEVSEAMEIANRFPREAMTVMSVTVKGL